MAYLRLKYYFNISNAYVLFQRLAFSGYDSADLFQSPKVSASLRNSSLSVDEWIEYDVINSGVIGATVNRTPVKNLSTPVHIK